jgi:hypothetical protein
MPTFSAEYSRYIHQGLPLYVETWRERKARYWRSPWGRKRCLVCFRKRRLQLHHLVYDHLGCERWYELRPLCASPCHPIVTATSRVLRRMTISRPVLVATYTVWLVARLPVIALGVLLLS